MTQTVYTLRRCKGSVTCWSATVGEHDFLCGTDYNLGKLIESLWERARKHGDDAPAFVLAIDAESEDAAMIERRKRDRQQMHDEIGRHQREIRYCKRRLAELPEWETIESEAA
jgi:hypothetical protein